MSVFTLVWLAHHLHHVFHVAGFRSHCTWHDVRHLSHPGYGHWYKVGHYTCDLWRRAGQMYPQVPRG